MVYFSIFVAPLCKKKFQKKIFFQKKKISKKKFFSKKYFRYIKKSDMKVPKVPPVRSRVQRHDREVND